MVRNYADMQATCKVLAPVQFGYENCAPSHDYGPAVRDFWLMHYVVSGKGKYCIGKKEYDLGTDDIFIIPPDAQTYYCADALQPWQYIWLGFTADGALPVALPDVLHAPELRSLFMALKSTTRRGSALTTFLTAQLWTLFSTLDRGEAAQPDYIDAALAQMHTEYMYGITATEIAAHLKLDRTYFSTLFKKRTGFSPKQYLLNFRMQQAAKLLCENKTGVTVAANSVGYTDVFNFSKMFKRHFGMSPSAYAKKNG